MTNKKNERQRSVSLNEQQKFDAHKFVRIKKREEEFIPIPEVVSIEIDQGKMYVDSRLLHQRLGVVTRHQEWMRRRIAEYGFIDGIDFERVLYSDNFGGSNLSNRKRGGDRRSICYMLSSSMAKELAIVENNEIGRKVRRYLIDLEERFHVGFMLPKIQVIYTLFEGGYYFDYIALLESCELSTKKGNLRKRIRKNPHEFIKDQSGKILITEDFGKTVASNAATSKLNRRAKLRRISFESQKALEGGVL